MTGTQEHTRDDINLDEDEYRVVAVGPTTDETNAITVVAGHRPYQSASNQLDWHLLQFGYIIDEDKRLLDLRKWKLPISASDMAVVAYFDAHGWTTTTI